MIFRGELFHKANGRRKLNPDIVRSIFNAIFVIGAIIAIALLFMSLDVDKILGTSPEPQTYHRWHHETTILRGSHD